MSEIKTNKLSSLTGTNNDITIDPDGTGDTIIASGNLGIGTTSPNSRLTTQTSSTSTSAFDFGVQVNNSFASNDSIAAIGFHNRADVNGTGVGAAIAYVGGGASGGSGNITFNIKDSSDISNVVDVADEAMRIKSNGTILLGRANATANTPGFLFNKNGNGFGTQSGGPVLYLNRTTTAGTNLQFRMNNSPVGAVNVSPTSTSYATSSDYRLKENVTDITGATDRLKQLNPVRFNFIIDADTTVDGFLAHEVQSVVPEAITGTHNEVDAEGNPEYQGIDQSKLVPLLVATIQEQQTAIEALTARVTALEAE
jgi:hypothetical protein